MSPKLAVVAFGPGKLLYLEQGIKLSEEQIKLIERISPGSSEHHVESSRHGKLLYPYLKLIGADTERKRR